MGTPEWVDSLRAGIQKALIESKRKTLKDEYGALFSRDSGRLPPDMELAWLDYMLEMERGLEESRPITVREHIGEPALVDESELDDHAVSAALDALWVKLAEHEIAVDFMGDVTDREMYRLLSGPLLDETFEPVSGFTSVFAYCTPTYEMVFWTEQFLLNVFTQERQMYLPYLDRQPWFDGAGQALAPAEVAAKLETIWRRLRPTAAFELLPLWTRVADEAGTVQGIVRWLNSAKGEYQQLNALFQLRPSPYTGWDVVDTVFLDALATLLADNQEGPL